MWRQIDIKRKCVTDFNTKPCSHCNGCFLSASPTLLPRHQPPQHGLPVHRHSDTGGHPHLSQPHTRTSRRHLQLANQTRGAGRNWQPGAGHPDLWHGEQRAGREVSELQGREPLHRQQTACGGRHADAGGLLWVPVQPVVGNCLCYVRVAKITDQGVLGVYCEYRYCPHTGSLKDKSKVRGDFWHDFL